MKKIWFPYIGSNILLGVLSILARKNAIILTVIVSILILFNLLLFITINRVSNNLHSTLSEIVNGQLNLSIKRSKLKIFDSLGQKINEYLKKIRTLVSQYQNLAERTIKESNKITNQSKDLQVVSKEIATTTQNTAEAASDQAESIANITKNMELFSEDVKEIYENAKISLNVAHNSKKVVYESFEVLESSFNKVEEIKVYNDKVVEEMLNLDKSIREINVISEVVETIASQTHLLALNATIEAARAGETGAGFAVVAKEVSKLADNSSKSAQQIKKLVNTLIDKINNLTYNMNEQTDIISNNVVYARTALEKSDIINESVDENIRATETIVQLSEKQNENIDEIVYSIEIINDTTQQNTAIAQEITASTQEQLSIIEDMYSSVVYLNDAIEYSNSIIVGFVDGFKVTDEMKEKVNKTKKLVTKISTSKEILTLGQDDLQQYLINEQKSLEYVELISFITKEGYQKVTTDDLDEETRDVSGRPYFLKAISGELFISEEYISTFSGNYNITICSPIFKNGIVEGALLADININEN